MWKEIGREFGKAGRASEVNLKSGPVKGRGENVGWKHPRPLFILREGWQSCWEFLEPKLANKGVPESWVFQEGVRLKAPAAASHLRGSLWSAWFWHQHGGFQVLQLGSKVSCAPSRSCRRSVSMSSSCHNASQSSWHAEMTVYHSNEVIYYPLNLGGRVPLHQTETDKASTLAKYEMVLRATSGTWKIHWKGLKCDRRSVPGFRFWSYYIPLGKCLKIFSPTPESW